MLIESEFVYKDEKIDKENILDYIEILIAFNSKHLEDNILKKEIFKYLVSEIVRIKIMSDLGWLKKNVSHKKFIIIENTEKLRTITGYGHTGVYFTFDVLEEKKRRINKK